MAWTPERIKHLRKACKQNSSLTAIAKEMGLSRTTVTEKIRALNITLKDKKVVEKKVSPAPVVVDPEKGLSLLELKHNSCRWPIKHTAGEGIRFCGAPAVLGKSYCAQHYAIAYINLKDKNKKNLNDSTAENRDNIETTAKSQKTVTTEGKETVIKETPKSHKAKEKEATKATVKSTVKAKKERAVKPAVKKAVKPSVKPVVKSVVKTAVKSTTKPVAKPIVKKTVKPVPAKTAVKSAPKSAPVKATIKTAVKANPLKKNVKAEAPKTTKVKVQGGQSTMSRLFSKLTGKKKA